MLEAEELATFLQGNVVAKDVIKCPYPGKGEDDRSVTVTVNPNGWTVETAFGDALACADHVKASIIAGLMKSAAADLIDDGDAI